MSAMALPIVAEGRGPYRRADLEHMPDDGRRYELIDGYFYVSAAPGHLHQRAVARLLIRLDAFAPAEFEVLPGPFAVALADDSELQPDLVVGRRRDFTNREIERPVLAVEILSPSTRSVNTILKRRKLEGAAVPSYWVVDPIARPAEASLVVWELGVDGSYQEVAKAVGHEEAVLTQPYPVTIVPADLVR